VRRIEAGKTNPSLAVIVSIAKAFGLRADDLLRNAAQAVTEADPANR
jgi:DNA-binding XRE family transcriptional regulator